jgi:4-amino-4-deoxy-L-arabinose transferase-like glycosyltransferase
MPAVVSVLDPRRAHVGAPRQPSRRSWNPLTAHARRRFGSAVPGQDVAKSSDPGSTMTPHLYSVARGSWILIIVSAVSVIAYVLTVAQRIRYPYELQFFEGSTVEVSARVTQGLPLYGPPTTTFTPWPYPPLYFLLTGELARFTGIGLPTLRVVSFAASFASLTLLVLIVGRATGSRTSGVVAAGLFAGTYRVSGAWFDSARVDSLFMALLLGAIYLGLRARTWRGGIGVGLLFGLAFLTKQNALIVALPVLTALCFRRRSIGVAATLVLVVSALGSVLIGDAVTGGWYSRYVVGQLLGQGANWGWLVEFWFVDLLLPFGLLVAALGGWAWQQRVRPQRVTSATTWYLLAGVTGLILAALAGRVHDHGYVNVSIPAHAAMAILAGLAVAGVVRHPKTTSRLIAASGAVFAAQLLVMALWHTQVIPTAQDRAAGDRFIADVGELPRPVLIPSHPFYLRLAGLPTHAAAIAMGDLLATRSGPARDALAAQLPWSLDGINSVLLDARSDTALFGSQLSRDFTLVTSSFIPSGEFRPVTDDPTAPHLLYVRTTELSQ